MTSFPDYGFTGRQDHHEPMSRATVLAVINPYIERQMAASATVRGLRNKSVFDALISLSHTQRRLAHRCKREALEWKARGHTVNFNDLVCQSDRYWRDAKTHLQLARNWRA